jgi:hypothetical protein
MFRPYFNGIWSFPVEGMTGFGERSSSTGAEKRREKGHRSGYISRGDRAR